MNEAAHSCRAILNVGRALGDEPFLVSQLIRIACATQCCNSIEWTLAVGEVDSKDLEALQQALQLEDDTNTFAQALRGERAALHQFLELLENGGIKPEELQGILGFNTNNMMDSFLAWKTRYDARAEHPLFLSMMTERVEAAQKPLHEQIALDRDFAVKVRSLAGSARVVARVLPAVEKVSDTYRRCHSALRCLITLVAAERYRRAEGKWPAALEQLRPRFLAEIPLDPFDGKPLRYKRLAEGVIVYAVGPDGTDDGGTLDRENPIKPGTDLGYRLWDVTQRRQAPKPKPASKAPTGAAR
jgi:hypothetical protein